MEKYEKTEYIIFMDETDRKICSIVQSDGRASSVEIARELDVSVSTANERVRRLVSTGTIQAWRAVLNPEEAGAGFCCFVLVDMAYDGEEEATRVLVSRPEVQEMHHIGGVHSCLLKVRVADTNAMQAFIQQVVKPLKAVQRTETMFVMKTFKETSELLITSEAEK